MDPSQGQNSNQPIELSQSAIVPVLDKVCWLNEVVY